MQFNFRNIPDPPIIIRLSTPYERNFVLKKCAEFKRLNNTQFCLRNIGLESDQLFFVNENLTPYNYKMFKTALILKKDKRIKSKFTLRGIVHIKHYNNDETVRIDCPEDLNELFLESYAEQ